MSPEVERQRCEQPEASLPALRALALAMSTTLGWSLCSRLGWLIMRCATVLVRCVPWVPQRKLIRISDSGGDTSAWGIAVYSVALD